MCGAVSNPAPSLIKKKKNNLKTQGSLELLVEELGNLTKDTDKKNKPFFLKTIL